MRCTHLLVWLSAAVSVSARSYVGHRKGPHQIATPLLPDRRPFGFGSMATGGGIPSSNNTFIARNMLELRHALTLKGPRTVYVKGYIKGNQINRNTTGTCRYYVSNSNVKQFNFTLYLKSMDESYVSTVKQAAAAGQTFEGRDATEYLDLLEKQKGWRRLAQGVQKNFETIHVKGDLTLTGWDANAFLNGVSLIFENQSNIIIRNLRISPPRDCFPSLETFPDQWKARYDAISFVRTTNAWLDGNVLEDGPQPVALDVSIPGWKVDRYDGLFDVEDGSDNITFSHNVVANHHKSLSWGGFSTDGSQNIGKMRFTMFANHFINSMSRNPLMRYGTFYIVNNLFSNYNNNPPFFQKSHEKKDVATRAQPYVPIFQYNLGIRNMSSVLVAGNYFDQSGLFPTDTSRIFSFGGLANPLKPATICSPPDLDDHSADLAGLADLAKVKNTLNGETVNMTANALQKFDYSVSKGTGSVAGGLKPECKKFAGQAMPKTFTLPNEVLEYVSINAGQFRVIYRREAAQ